MRLFCEDTLAEIVGKRRIVQINHSRTTGRRRTGHTLPVIRPTPK